jgi:hypothetical protein
MLSIGILFDFLIDFTEVLSGDGGVIGNILNKSDVGDYSYNNVNSTHPHTPNSIAGSGSNTDANRAYTYDANGSMTKNGPTSDLFSMLPLMSYW